jgi:hypothetical protein
MNSALSEAVSLMLTLCLQVDPWEGEQSPRLGFGQFVDAAGDIALMTGRQHFLDAVVAECPEVLESLRGKPFVLVHEFVKQLLDWAVEISRNSSALNPDVEETWTPVLQATLTQLDPIINRWTQDYHLGTPDQPWGARAFAWTLFRRAVLTNMRRPLDDRLWDLPIGMDATDASIGIAAEMPESLRDEVAIVFTDFTWNRRMETRSALERRLLGEIKRQLREQVDRYDQEAKQRGDVSTPAKPSGSQHFRWLARYQVKGESFTHIANEAGVSRQAVMAAITEAAAIINLPLRERDRRGRPRKRREPRIVKLRDRRMSIDN